MDKRQAREQIRDLFGKPFQLEGYRHFLLNLLNRIEYRDVPYSGNLIPDAFKDHVTRYWRIGKYVDPEGVELDLLAVEVKSFSKLDRARTALRNFAVNRLKQFEKDCSLVAFYAKDDNGADWRFSFIKIEHEAWRDEKGKVRLKTELTPARRYSYLVGVHEDSHTAQNQLLDLLIMDYANPTVEQIEAAFSIEKVTAEFFEQYKGLYLKLSEQLKGQPLFQEGNDAENTQAVARFAKKLLGQIVFLYFLQKKGWLGLTREENWGAGDKRFLRNLLIRAEEAGGNFYSNYLQYLFYEALAQERKEQDDPTYYDGFDCRIPFLNGGLFEADYDWQSVHVAIPNELFTNSEKNKDGDIGTGILDVFDRYNFTIKEDEPLEKEVAVDPEMLGKVFENMLEVVERKSKGAFYTPREIVHYMCQESLIHYLDNELNNYIPTYREFGSKQPSLFGNAFNKGQLKLTQELQDIKVPKADLDILIRKGHLALENDQRVLDKGKETDTYRFQLPESVRKHAQSIDAKLASIKVCDPAIGSGAFPVGLLHEIVNARLALAPHSGNTHSVYSLKRHTIRESLYGVDIDASAIDIARLRLWLSLIVDEDDYNTIEALPNLDYKIVRGDSLIGFPEIWNSSSFDKIEGLKGQFFNETDQRKKAALKQQIDVEIQARMASSRQVFGPHVGFDFRLHFSEVWHEKGGFDIVIGNPPYVQIQNFSGQQIQKHWEQQRYDTFAKTGDIYCLFYEKGYRVLRKGGALCFISSNKWMRANYGQKLRRFFIQKTNPLILIDFSSFPVFETATVDTNILVFEKTANKAETKACVINKSFVRHGSLDLFLQENHIRLDKLTDDSWAITEKNEYFIKECIDAVGSPLKGWDVSINYGIKTGFNDAFIIDGKTKDELIASDVKNAEVIKPVLNGRDIKRYQVNFHDSWLLFIPWHFPLHELSSIRGASLRAENSFKEFYPKLYEFLVQYKDDLSKRNSSETGIRYEWYALQRCAASYHREFGKEKIVWGNLALSAQFAMAEPNVFLNAPSNMITGGGKYVLAILNSSVGDYYIRSLGVTRNGGYFEYKPMFVEKLPVPKLSTDKQAVYIYLVDYVLYLKKKELKLQLAYFEQLIDGLVYELYFPDEIKSARKEILEHLGELKPITESMRDEEKLAVIQSEFDRLYDPTHPVRNHLETLDSVEVVRTIREALKK
ncbi:MAG: Eco57I restriction-modification methylase domain-containing protein [Syntrophobacteraceae bacterium]